jgi:hypothetical protein
MTDICSNLEVIPQYNDTCWFNAILMACFYSQKMRKLLINKVSKTWNKSDNLFKFFKTILKNNYKKQVFDKIKPEIFLLKIMSKYEISLYKLFKVKFDYRWHEDYIYNFLKLLNVNYLDINYSHTNNTFLFNFMKYMTPVADRYIFTYDIDMEVDKEKKEIEKIIRDIPDVLILSHSELSRKNHKTYETFLTQNRDYNVYNANNYGIDDIAKDDIINYKDEIRLFGQKYKLDSVLLTNYDTKASGIGHDILGLHCNNKRYIYNGWVQKNNKPCSLFKFNWDLKSNNEFCINRRKCSLDDTVDKKLCFSFNKGNRLLVYVKQDDSESLSIESSLISNLSLSNVNDIIRDYYNLDNLTIDTIKKILKSLDIKFKDDDNLYDLLYNYLKLNYNYSKSSSSSLKKRDLISAITELRPDISGLNEKTKEELEKIYQIVLRLSTMKRKRSN